jgi:hypothetical protein
MVCISPVRSNHFCMTWIAGAVNPINARDVRAGEGFRVKRPSRFFRYDVSSSSGRLQTAMAMRSMRGIASSSKTLSHPSPPTRDKTARMYGSSTRLMSDRQCSSKNVESDARVDLVCDRKPARVVPHSRCLESRQDQLRQQRLLVYTLLLFIKIRTACSSSPEKYAQLAAFVLISSSTNLRDKPRRLMLSSHLPIDLPGLSLTTDRKNHPSLSDLLSLWKTTSSNPPWMIILISSGVHRLHGSGKINV